MPAPAWVYVHDLRATGVVRNAIAIARRLGRDRPTALVAGYAHGFLLDEAGADPGFTLHRLHDGAPNGKLARWLVAPKLAAMLSAEPPGVLISAGKLGHPTVLAAARGRPLPARVYRMSNEIARASGPRTFGRTALARLVARDAAAVTFVGDTVARSPAFARAFAQGRAEVVHNGVDLAAARAGAAGPSPHPWFAEGVPVVLGVGRLHRQKNWPLLIDAAAIVRRERRVRVAILGGGATADALRARADAAGLGDDFLLAGVTDNVFAWGARAAAFALPSRWEGSSVALLEAMAVGAPVVATAQAGDAAHVLDGGRYGLLADADDAPGFAAALLQQLGPDRVLPGDRAAAFSLEAACDRYAAIVARLCGEDAGEDREAA